MEKAIQHAKRITDQLSEFLKKDIAQPARMQTWRQEVEELKSRLQSPNTVISVVGDTGAGKSSLLNSLLGEESVLPTNGMRACTAVVVEIAYHEMDYFEAEIEFLAKDEWQQELKILLEDLIGMSSNPICNERKKKKKRFKDIKTWHCSSA